MGASGASIAQPSVLPASRDGRAGRGAHFTRSGVSSDCLVRAVPYVEQMTPIFRREAFMLLAAALRRVPEDRLGSDSGLETLWCALAATTFPSRPACVIVTPLSVVHMNTHTIRRYDKNEREHYFNPKVNLLPYLAKYFDAEVRSACIGLGRGLYANMTGADNRKMPSLCAALVPPIGAARWNELRTMGGAAPNSISTAAGCWGLDQGLD